MYRNFMSKELVAIHQKIRPMAEGAGRQLEITDSGKFKLNTRNTMAAPWIYVKSGRFRVCNLWRTWEEMFPVWEGKPYVPSGCQNCWKVVIRPKTVYQLFMLLELLKATELPSKCGIELRDYASHLYGGFIYADSKEQGLEYFNFVQGYVAEKLGEDIAAGMILKRGCTEFDQKMPSDQWSMPESHQKLETILADNFEETRSPYRDSDFILACKKQNWIKHANGAGDMTWKKIINHDSKLSVECVTYHQEGMTNE